jgi:predicted transcriptional regulator of viral defense system
MDFVVSEGPFLSRGIRYGPLQHTKKEGGKMAKKSAVQKAGGVVAGTLGEALALDAVEKGRFAFSAEEAVEWGKSRGMEPAHVYVALSGLARSGRLERIRRGLYAVGPMYLGGAPVPDVVCAAAAVRGGVVGYLSALSYHGLVQQIPRFITICSPVDVRKDTERTREEREPGERHFSRVRSVKVQYMTVPADRLALGVRRVMLGGPFTVPMYDRERSVLDAFIVPKLYGGIQQAMSLLIRNIHVLFVDHLADLAVKNGCGAVARRLGYTLERVGCRDRESLRKLLQVPVNGYVNLDPEAPRRGRCSGKWGIINNLQDPGDCSPEEEFSR